MGQLDYLAIFLLMAAESSILPVPSELVMIPAGYLAATGKLDAWLALLAANAGSVAGSVGSYYLALWLGRPFLLRFGKYVLIDKAHLDKTEGFLRAHGEISIFTGRFLPGIRHLISLPAGLGRMHMGRFILYTLVGASMWNAVLLVLGYVIGENQAWVRDNMALVIWSAVAFAAATVIGYIYWQRRRKA
ncbi:MAG: DedA family protein [Gammaproteobacteria bacterium]